MIKQKLKKYPPEFVKNSLFSKESIDYIFIPINFFREEEVVGRGDTYYTFQWSFKKNILK